MRLGFEHNTLHTNVNARVSSSLQYAPIWHDRELNEPSIIIPGVPVFIREGNVIAIPVDVGICCLCGGLPGELIRTRDAPRIRDDVFDSLLHGLKNVVAARVLKTKSGVAANPVWYFSFVGSLAWVTLVVWCA